MIGPKYRLGSGPAVAVGLSLQLLVLLVSLTAYYQISIFCTGSRYIPLSWLFGLLHIGFLALLFLGLSSVIFRAARPAYLILILPALAVLPVQAILVEAQILHCNFL